MLYTRKGDSGTTKVFNSKDRISKSSLLTDALGSVDEINSFLGLCKVKSADLEINLNSNKKISDIVHSLQEDLFIVQAELAGAEMAISEEKVKKLEEITDGIEKILPPITTFFISGGTELAALFDTARTIARRAERRMVTLKEASSEVRVGDQALAYMNRLSSVLYALARYANHAGNFIEKSPNY